MHILHRNPLQFQMYFTVTDKKTEKSTNLQIVLSITELVQNSRVGGGQERRKSLEKKNHNKTLFVFFSQEEQQTGQLMSRFLF